MKTTQIFQKKKKRTKSLDLIFFLLFLTFQPWDKNPGGNFDCVNLSHPKRFMEKRGGGQKKGEVERGASLQIWCSKKFAIDP